MADQKVSGNGEQKPRHRAFTAVANFVAYMSRIGGLSGKTGTGGCKWLRLGRAAAYAARSATKARESRYLLYSATAATVSATVAAPMWRRFGCRRRNSASPR